MKLFLFVLDLVGFLARFIAAVVVALALSLLKVILQRGACLIAYMQKIRFSNPLQVSKAQKNNADWIVVKLGKYSLLLGKKNEIQN